VYYPFGEEATAFNQDTERMKFTGHERDLASLAGAGDDLDYMHARFCSPMVGRFLSVDPRLDINPKRPGAWNRYSYVGDNPLIWVDPNGEKAMEPAVRQLLEAFFGTDLGHINVEWGAAASMITDVARGAGGVTFGSTIYLSQKSTEGYLNGTEDGVALIAHETTHTFDYAALGTIGFLVRYALEANDGFIHTRSMDKSYHSITTEQRANKVEDLILKFLDKNPDIQSKVAKGESLSSDDLKKVQAYAVSLVKTGVLHEGFQYIQGRLVYVRLP
jgi:RHS repeat-associated protein